MKFFEHLVENLSYNFFQKMPINMYSKELKQTLAYVYSIKIEDSIMELRLSRVKV